MKQLLILSGKGGTGKTTVASAFIKLSQTKGYADCDVDAPNLHLVAGHRDEPKHSDYIGMQKARIDKDICIVCDKCIENCRFDAIKKEDGYKVDSFSCEGCGVCEYLCPVDAITMHSEIDGELMLYQEEGTVFSTAKLKMGSGTSGKLVTEVKKQMNEVEIDTPFVIIDGSPGIGCPVIASLSGVDMALIVAEPSISGINDMERIIKTAASFGTKLVVCINKFDTNIGNSEKIEEFCKQKNIFFAGKIPFDRDAVKAINAQKTIVEVPCDSGEAVKKVYKEVIKLFY